MTVVGQKLHHFASIRRLTYVIVVIGGLLVAAIIVGYVLLLVAPERSRMSADILLPFVMVLSFVEILAVITLAFRLWSLHSPAKEPADEVRAGLAVALGTGVAIALAILVLQLAVQAISDQREIRVQRENIRFTVGITQDLTGFVAPRDPADPSELLDMAGYWFRGKNMPLATLDNANLRGANFVFADLNGSSMRGVLLTENSTDQGEIRSDLRSATLFWVDLTGSEVGNASFLDADLSKAYLCGVDLRNANLTRADLRGATLDEDPQNIGGVCEVPGQLPDEKPEGACWPNEGPGDLICGREARTMAKQRKG